MLWTYLAQLLWWSLPLSLERPSISPLVFTVKWNLRKSKLILAHRASYLNELFLLRRLGHHCQKSPWAGLPMQTNVCRNSYAFLDVVHGGRSIAVMKSTGYLFQCHQGGNECRDDLSAILLLLRELYNVEIADLDTLSGECTLPMIHRFGQPTLFHEGPNVASQWFANNDEPVKIHYWTTVHFQ